MAGILRLSGHNQRHRTAKWVVFGMMAYNLKGGRDLASFRKQPCEKWFLMGDKGKRCFGRTKTVEPK